MYQKTFGVVLRENDYNDNDKILTVLTKELGKITVKARGVKSRASRLKAACQLLAYSEFTLLEYQGKYTVTEAVTQEIFPELRNNIELLSLASYFAQITETAAQEEESNDEILALLLNCLYALAKLGQPQKKVKAVFELRLACVSGFMPDLSSCTKCGNDQPDRFNITTGSLQCSVCRTDSDDGLRMPINPGVLGAMRFICYVSPKKLFSFQISENSMDILGSITESYLCVHFERGFYTLDFYKSLFIKGF